MICNLCWQCWLCWQEYLRWWIIHIIVPPLLCGLEYITLPNHSFWSFLYYKLILQKFRSPSVYHVCYVSLLFNFFIPLQYDSTMSYAPHKYFLKFIMAHLTAYNCTKTYILNSKVVTPLILRWKKLVVGVLLPGTFQICTFQCPFLVPLTFFASTESSDGRIISPITSLENYLLM